MQMQRLGPKDGPGAFLSWGWGQEPFGHRGKLRNQRPGAGRHHGGTNLEWLGGSGQRVGGGHFIGQLPFCSGIRRRLSRAPRRQEAPICVCTSVIIPPPRLSVCEKCGEILLTSDWRDQWQWCQWKEHDVYDCYTGRKPCIYVSDLTSLNGNLHFLICAMGIRTLTTGHYDAHASWRQKVPAVELARSRCPIHVDCLIPTSSPSPSLKQRKPLLSTGEERTMQTGRQQGSPQVSHQRLTFKLV